jgi:hypothetical protein
MVYRTDGERLFIAIRDQVLTPDNLLSSDWRTVESVLHLVSGSLDFPEYVRGAVAIHAVRRLLRYWDAQYDVGIAPELAVRRVSKFISEDVFPTLEQALAVRLARLVTAAVRVSRKSPTQTVRKAVIPQRSPIQCYLCARALSAQAPPGDPQEVTIEHIWPQSIGGESVEDNLLPACVDCQNEKKDLFSWEWFGVHNLVLPPEPSVDALRSVPRGARIARHYFHVMNVCREDQISLKAGFMRVGPATPIRCRKLGYGMPVTFFELLTVPA